MDFLSALAAIRNPVLDVLMQLITYCGEETLFMVIALTIFWCVSKKYGYYVLITGFFGTILSQFLKLVFRIPRPWLLKPGFKPVDSAIKGASGYSFPSGHTQNAVATYGGIARFTKKGIVRWVCIALALLISFSRMYLGVHTLLDVGVAFAIAAVLLFVLYPILDRSEDKPVIMYVFIGLMLAVSIGYVCYVNLYVSADEFDAQSIENYTDGVKHGWQLFGALLALPFVYFFDSKKLHFEVRAPLVGQILKVALGMAGLLAVKEGLKALFNLAFGEAALVTNLPRYFAVVLFAGCIWPMTFPLFQKIGKKKERT